MKNHVKEACTFSVMEGMGSDAAHHAAIKKNFKELGE
jgi:hypothetical protein